MRIRHYPTSKSNPRLRRTPLLALRLPLLKLPRPQLQLKHAINLIHTPPLHLRNEKITNHHAHRTTRRIRKSRFATQIALIGIEHVRQAETRDGRCKCRYEPADSLSLGAKLERGGFGADGEGGGPDADAADNYRHHHASGCVPVDALAISPFQ
jgi:hypothetical protein